MIQEFFKTNFKKRRLAQSQQHERIQVSCADSAVTPKWSHQQGTQGQLFHSSCTNISQPSTVKPSESSQPTSSSMDLSRTTNFCVELQQKIAQISAVQNTELGLRMYKFQLTMQ